MFHIKTAIVIIAFMVPYYSPSPLNAQPVETSSTDVMTSVPIAVKETTSTESAEDLTTPTTAPLEIQTTSSASADTPTSETLPGGILYQIIRPGTGAEATTTGTRLIHYTLFLLNGHKIESSRDADFPVPFTFTPGADQAIKGMEAGTNGMRVGEIRKLYVPSNLAYGNKIHSNIPPNSDLVFDVELVDVK